MFACWVAACYGHCQALIFSLCVSTPRIHPLSSVDHTVRHCWGTSMSLLSNTDSATWNKSELVRNSQMVLNGLGFFNSYCCFDYLQCFWYFSPSPKLLKCLSAYLSDISTLKFWIWWSFFVWFGFHLVPSASIISHQVVPPLDQNMLKISLWKSYSGKLEMIGCLLVFNS